jgi:hypothetical protein
VVHGSKLAEPEPKGSLAMKTIGSVSPSDAGRRSDSDWIGRGKCRFGHFATGSGRPPLQPCPLIGQSGDHDPSSIARRRVKTRISHWNET